MTLKLTALFAVLFLVGCADLNTNVYNSEKLLADGATASVAGFNRYYEIATNGASPQKIAELNSQRDQVWGASRKLSAVLAVTELSRLIYATNATPVNKALLQQNLSSLAANSGNVTSTVANALSPYSTVKGLP
jgi:hypothetical protein